MLQITRTGQLQATSQSLGSCNDFMLYERNYNLQDESYEDMIEAVETFAARFDPPLLPALKEPGDPPDYDKANKVPKVSEQ